MPIRPSPTRSGALGLAALVAVMFFVVSGGPFGLEGLVGAVGPGVALLLIVATPLLYSVPEALLVGELASMLPVEGGYYQWVRRAFGETWGLWNGWLSWAYSLMDMAIYPVLLLQYLRWFVPDLGRWESWAIACAVIWGATWLNLRGTRAVGNASGAFAVAVVAPFAVLSAVASVRWLTSGATTALGWTVPTAGSTFAGALGIGLSQAIWNYSGWDNASTISGEIDRPSSTYPRALARTLPMVTAIYLVAVVPVLMVTRPDRWTDGAWPELGATVAGRWCGAWIAAAGIVSAFALFNALLLAYSRIPLVLARDGILPAGLAATDARGTPRRAIVVSAVAYTVMALLPFGGLLAGDVLLYTAALALEFAALLKLRRAEPELRGDFRVPLPVPALAVLATLPIALIVLAVVLEVRSKDIGLAGVAAACVLGAAGPIFHLARRKLRPAGVGTGAGTSAS